MLNQNYISGIITQPLFFKFLPEEIQVSGVQVEKALGYKNVNIPDEVEHTVQETLGMFRNLIEPQAGIAVYSLAQGSITKTSINIGAVEFSTGPIISSYLKNSTHAALFICTIGKELETLSRNLLNDGDYLKGYVIDAVASEAVECVCDLLEIRLTELVSRDNFNITNRYSPGYCNWHVSEQQKLFSLLPERPCGVTLTESSLMLPVKSVSGIIGIGLKAKKSEYNCSFCGIENCYKKKEDA